MKIRILNGYSSDVGNSLFNFESPMVKDFLLANAFYWLEFYHADGLRLDDVDSMLYLDFGREYGQWRPNIYGTNENLAAVELLKHLNLFWQRSFQERLRSRRKMVFGQNLLEVLRMTILDFLINGTITGQEIF